VKTANADVAVNFLVKAALLGLRMFVAMYTFTTSFWLDDFAVRSQLRRGIDGLKSANNVEFTF
jgi:hypothetical protein